MYSKVRFYWAKADLVFGFLHRSNNSAQQATASFLRHLLSTAAEQGYVTRDDVQQAMESSGALNPSLELEMDPESADEFLPSLWRIGDSYIGELAPHQMQELRQLRQLCLSASNGDNAALAQIEAML